MGRKAVVVLAVLLGLFIVGGLVVNFYPVADFASEAINDASKSAPPRAIEPARESNRDIYPSSPNSYPDEAIQDSIGQGSTPYGEAKDQVNRDLDSKDEATRDSDTDRLKLDDNAKLDINESAPIDSPTIPAAPDKAANEEAMHSNASKASQDESAVTAPETDKTDKTTNSYESKTSKDESKEANDSANEDSKAREVDSITNSSPSENSENIEANVASPMEADSAAGDNETSTEDESINADENKPNEENRTHSLGIENEASPSPNPSPNATIDSTDSTTSESSSDEYRGNENNQIDPMVSPSAPISMLDAEDEEDENANEISEASISATTQLSSDPSSDLGENKIDSIDSRPNANETNEKGASPPPSKNKARSPTCQVAPSCNAASIIKGLATASIQSHANVRYNEIKRLEGAAAAQDFLALWQATRASILPKLVARVSNLKEESSSTDFRQRICRVSYYTEVLEDLGENWVDKKGDRSPNYQVSYTVSCANGEVNLSISSSSAKKLSPTKPSNLLRTESKTTDLRNATRDSLPSCNEPAIQAALNKTGTALHLRARIHEEANRKGNAAGRGFLALWEETKSLIEPKLRSHILSIQPQGVRGAARICLASYYTEVLEDFGHGWSDKRGARSANYLLRFSLRRKDEGGIELQVLSHKKRVRHF